MTRLVFLLALAGWGQATTQPAISNAPANETYCGPICFRLVQELYAPGDLGTFNPEMFGDGETSALALRDRLREEGFGGALCARFDGPAELRQLGKPAILVLQLRPEQKHYVLYVGEGRKGGFALLNYEPGELRELSAAELEKRWTREAIIVSREKLTPTSQPAR
jgi:hypothetical protein